MKLRSETNKFKKISDIVLNPPLFLVLSSQRTDRKAFVDNTRNTGGYYKAKPSETGPVFLRGRVSLTGFYHRGLADIYRVEILCFCISSCNLTWHKKIIRRQLWLHLKSREVRPRSGIYLSESRFRWRTGKRPGYKASETNGGRKGQAWQMELLCTSRQGI